MEMKTSKTADGTFECSTCSYRGGKLQILELIIPMCSITPLEGERDTLVLDLELAIRDMYSEGNEYLSIRRVGNEIDLKLLMRGASSEDFFNDARGFLGFLQDQGLYDNSLDVVGA